MEVGLQEPGLLPSLCPSEHQAEADHTGKNNWPIAWFNLGLVLVSMKVSHCWLPPGCLRVVPKPEATDAITHAGPRAFCAVIPSRVTAGRGRQVLHVDALSPAVHVERSIGGGNVQLPGPLWVLWSLS